MYRSTNHNQCLQTEKYAFFADSKLFAEYPYLLPCLVAGSVTLFGGFLSLFLNRDGGERTGGIHLPTEKDIEVAASVLSKVKAWLGLQIARLWNAASTRQAIHLDTTTDHLDPSSAAAGDHDSPAVSPSILESERNPFADRRRTSKQYGSAYGYGRRPSGVGSTLAGESGLRIPSMRRRTGRSVSVATSNRYDPENEMVHSFAER